MSYRITNAHLESKVSIINGMLGYEDPQWNTVGSVRLDGAYGGTAVYRISNTSGGVNDLMGGHLTKREAANFLSGMIAALRIARETSSV